MDIGIDLGTTFSVIAVHGKVEVAGDYPAGVYLEPCDVTIIPTPYEEPTFPSVVIEDPENPGAYLYGSDALAKLEEGYAPVMFSKRKIGTKETVPLGSGDAVAKDVAREFLRYLKQCAEQALGRPVTRGVITHPAYFDRAAVEETRQAAIEAGFDMSLTEQMLMEPVAAALAYTRTDRRDPLHVLTYDLGGGTFDVTYLVRRGGLIDMRAFDGDHLMGGYNFDRELIGWVRRCLEAKNRRIVLDESDPAHRASLARLLRLAEQVKIALANAPSDDAKVEFRARGVLVDVDGKDVQINERISRAEFVALIDEYLGHAIDCCRRALEKGGVEPGDVDEVLLVGGSTYGPWIAESVKRAFPQLVPKRFHPDLCVGAGAAIHARMVLPALAGQAGCRLVLDVRDVSVLETINVPGRVTQPDGRPLAEPPIVSLRRPDVAAGEPAPAADDGRFLFEDVALSIDQLNHFVLTVSDRAGRTLLEHEFQVRHAEESTETSGVSTVLPKPLFIETLDGLVPLAEEGIPLPAQCEQTFTRENDNPSISLKLFQERHAVGEVRIEGIPPEGGRGSIVHLKVQVTAKNEISGTATVRGRDGRVVLQSPVRITFDLPEVPSAARLWDEFSMLQSECMELFSTAGDGRDETRATVMRLLDRAQRLFEQQPLERQEVAVALRRVRDLLEVPRDDMHPTRKEFCEVVANCRKRIHRMTREAHAAIRQAEADVGEIDRGITASAQRILQKTAKLAPILDRLEAQGLAAHTRRDRRTWGRVSDAVTDLEHQIADRERGPAPGAPPTPISKAMASMSLARLQDRLDGQRRQFEDDGRLEDWRNEFNQIQNALDETAREIAAVDDDLPADQGLAGIRRIFQRRLQPLEDAIGRLGVDVSRAG